MARIRVYCFTYHRDELLPRALQSLLNQTYSDWVCEIHNDLPGNDFVQCYAQQLNDPRITVINHEENLGIVRSFNHAFAGCFEEYVAILEDDNWWEPGFLTKMLLALETHPTIQVAWSNMLLHQEMLGNSWQDLHKTIWPRGGPEITLFEFAQPRQAFAQLHSNGALLLRNQNMPELQIPVSLRSDFMEHVRERAFQHPILLVNEPLANFAITLKTSRPQSAAGMHAHYYLLLASFFKWAGNDQLLVDGIWAEMRKSPVRATHNLIYAGLCDRNCRPLLKRATTADWLFFFAYTIRHPGTFLATGQAKRRFADLWQYLQIHTARRFTTDQKILNP